MNPSTGLLWEHKTSHISVTIDSIPTSIFAEIQLNGKLWGTGNNWCQQYCIRWCYEQYYLKM
jgi:hypothetical protein